VLLVDKPEGPTSFDVIAKLRRALGTRAIGHAGTLDPLATGLLVVLVGRYTRLSQMLTGADKSYEAEVCFGTRTSTDDREGEVLEEGDPSGITEERVRAALAEMEGPIQQVPPAYSAISVGGERLYAKARRGEAVEVPPRDVVLHRLELVGFEAPKARVFVRCSKGTYIRALARDLGDALGVPAHLSALRRTASGSFDIEQAATLDALTAEEGSALAALRGGPEALPGVSFVEVDAAGKAALGHGQTAAAEGLGAEGEVALAVHEGDLVAIVRAEAGRARVVRGLPRPPSLDAAPSPQ
jgi:tRNA pseudouridine55 synthase